MRDLDKIRYKHPAIQEAICQIQFERSHVWNPTFFGYFHARIKERFPKVSYRDTDTIRFVHNKHATEPSRKRQTLMRFSDETGKKAVHFGDDVLAANLAYQYSGWADFKPLIMEMVRNYLEIVQPDAVSEVALRYINRLAGRDGLTCSEFLSRDTPFIPSGLFEWRHPFYLSGVYPVSETMQLRYSITSIQQEHPNSREALLLDLACSGTSGLSADSELLGEYLEKIHLRLVEFFEQVITDKLRKIMVPAHEPD